MCREAVATRDNTAEVQGLSKSLNFSILLMMGFLFTMVAVILVMAWLNIRARNAADEAVNADADREHVQR
jgi:heme/copper-type cytochrome/quinol oxidase subunit 2